MARLTFEQWMARKGLTPAEIVASGVNSWVELQAMGQRLGVTMPDKPISEFLEIWESTNQSGQAVVENAAKTATKKPAPTTTSAPKTKSPTRSKTGSTTTRRKTTRKKTNIKDEEK